MCGGKFLASVTHGRIEFESEGHARGAARLPCNAVPRWPAFHFVAPDRAVLHDSRCDKLEIACTDACDKQFLAALGLGLDAARKQSNSCRHDCYRARSDCNAHD